MLSNLFTASPAVWSGLIASMIALPIIIHLINRVRHKTIDWAAMEFLLKSYRKNRNWVWLKQMLLLLSRIAVLLVGLFLLAQVGCNDQRVAALLGGQATHRYIIVDDSFSMSDRGNQGSAMDRAKSAMRQIVGQARTRSNQKVSVLRTSAIQFGKEENSRVPDFDIENSLADSAFVGSAETVISAMVPSSFASDAADSLEAVSQLISERDDEQAIVYLLSDFREKDWNAENEVSKSLASIANLGADIELIRCAQADHRNLAITGLEVIGNVRVAETPLMMEVTVTNFSDTSADKVQVSVASIVYQQRSASSNSAPPVADADELPTVFIESIEAGKSETRQFPVWFGQPGQHAVVATIGEDAVAIDNERFCSLEIKEESRVLLIDQSRRLHADFLALALNPNNLTGIRSDIQMADFLRSNDAEMLSRYDVIALCDPGQIDELGIKNLQRFVSEGGGLVYFGGPSTNFAFFNRYFYDNGQGLLPVELAEAEEVADREDDMPADVAATRHPIFAPVNDVRNSLLDLVQVKTVLRPSFSWVQKPPANASVIATFRSDPKYPLMVESQYGNGRTMLVMTTAGPLWNNWMRNATFPPILLLLEDYLAAGKYSATVNLVGQSIPIRKPTGSVTPDVLLWSPTAGDDLVERKIKLKQTDEGLAGRIGDSSLSKVNLATAQPGLYELLFRNMDSSSSVDRIAVNVDTAESGLQLISDEKLAQFSGNESAKIAAWDQLDSEPEQKQDATMHRMLLILLVALLIAEQTLGWMCSYH